MKIGIASDHRGFELKEQIKEHLQKKYEFVDYGTDSKESVDYPDYAFKLGEAVSQKEIEFGIAICGSGIGISIACNKVKRVRCAKIDKKEEIVYTRNDNDSNIIAFSAEKSLEDAIDFVTTFIETPFSKEERHQKRILKIEKYEDEHER